MKKENTRSLVRELNMRVELAKYIQLSIYTRQELCEANINKHGRKLVVNLPDEKQPPLSDFHFYLAFENSLCEDYITEKFWKILEGRHLVIPIVMGGLSMEEYENIAPPNSYIHVKNFTSPKHLAEHLHYVVSNEKAFNYYLEWRNKYRLYKNGNHIGRRY
ncbi:FucTA [Bugula neritina]|uniref:Fucosyltransferase n=1 Tax=Bugula neritina TaxID=10212 RepID=A0A7J7K2U8_BUGNE|nr:FucTA [Bugula neritina]